MQAVSREQGESLLDLCEMVVADHDQAYVASCFPELPAPARKPEKSVLNHSFVKSEISLEQQATILTPKKLLEMLSRGRANPLIKG